MLAESAKSHHVNNVISNVIKPTDDDGLGETDSVLRQTDDDEPEGDITEEEVTILVEPPEEINREEDDPFPGDDLENEAMVQILFNLLDFYPTDNLVEAYLRSKNGTSRRDNLQALQLWEKVLQKLHSMKTTLQLNLKDQEDVNDELEKIERYLNETEAGLECPRDILVSLPESTIDIIPEIIASLEGTMILTFSTEGCCLSTGFGTE